MSSKTVLYHKKDQIGNIVLNRPQAGNTINAQIAQELSDICSKVNQDANIRAVTITGAGNAFCVGTNWDSSLSSPKSKNEPSIWENDKNKSLSVATAIARIDCPVIAAINGDALGQGLELALACDLRIAAETARLGFTQITSELIPWDGGTQRLPRIVGRAKAMEMILLGELIGTKEAYRIGLVNKVVTLKELPLVTADIAKRMISSAPLALKFAKEAVYKGADLTLEQGLRLETDLYLLLQTTRDRTEGITAFQEKRRPEFRGK